MPKRLIEDLLPLAELNKTAQTGGGIGSFNAMHPYFARRPLTASRAMTLAALVDAPADEQERKALERLVVELSQKEWPEHDARLDQARDLIRKAHGGRAPRVLDPFAGGGSMPLEAMRLGCEATALDLNPVAYLALIGSLVYPQKMTADRRPRIAEGKPATGDGEQKANDSQPQAANGGQEQWSLLKFSSAAAHSPPSTSHFPLVDDVRYWAEWVLTQAQARIGACYPNDPDGAIPTAYLWAKTVICPRCGGEVPLIKRFWLQQGERSEQSVAYRLQVDREAKTYTVEILRGALAQQAQPDQGTMRGATVECIYCGAPTERQEIAAQAQAGQMGQHLLALALSRSGESGRDFRAAGAADRAAFARAAQLLDEAQAEGYEFWGLERMLSVIPDEPTPPNLARSVSIRLYGVDSWGQDVQPTPALGARHPGAKNSRGAAMALEPE